MVIGSMTGVSGPRGAGRFAGPAALAGQRWLRLAWRGLFRPCRSGLVTGAMISRDARVIWSGGKGARVPGRAAHCAGRAGERDPQRVLAGGRGGGADQLPDGVTGASARISCPAPSGVLDRSATPLPFISDLNAPGAVSICHRA